MTTPQRPELGAVLEPLRDLAIGQLLDEIARALDRGDKVRHEPMIRDASDRIVRDGVLHLPRRGDLAVTAQGRTVVQRIQGKGRLNFAPVELEGPAGFTAVIHPFRWDAARLYAAADGKALTWTPIRRWFLEAFQSRYSEVAPDLDGVVHALLGPWEEAGGWCFEVDLGSAPVEAVGEMIDAFAASGAEALVVGRPDPVTNETATS